MIGNPSPNSSSRWRRSTQSSWQWFWLSQRPSKLLVLQAFIFMHLFLPFIGTVNSHSHEEALPPTDSTLFPRITISTSYSTTNYKAGPQSHIGNISSHNNTKINFQNNDYSNGMRRHIFSKTHIHNSTSSRRRNTRTHVKPNSHGPVQNKHGARQRKPLKSVRGETAGDTLPNSSGAAQVSKAASTTIKPTMHPLRVLQTEFSPPAKVSFVQKSVKPLGTTANRTNNNYEKNLENHRFSSSEAILRPTSVTEQLLTDEIKAQLDLINRGIMEETQLSKPGNDTRANFARGKQQSLPLLPASPMKEGRSALDFGDPSPPSTLKSNRTSFGGSEPPTNLKSVPFSNYYNTLIDNIAEEDHQYEVTELVNQYPMGYEHHQDDHHDEQPQPSSSHNFYDHRYHQKQQQQQQQQQHHRPQQGQEMMYELPSQSPHHNYHRRPSLKPKKNRPKLNSYYDQNYYSPTGSAQSVEPTNTHEHEPHYEYKKEKEYHYYENSEQGNYNGNDYKGASGSHYSKPLHSNGNPQEAQLPTSSGPEQQYYFQQQYHQQSPQVNDHGPGHQEYRPSVHLQQASVSPTTGNRHPAPQPYKGEHDNETADTIMDRFEVFYQEYKLLAWIGLFGLVGLGFVILIFVLYMRNPPTEVVTARSKMTEILNDPSILRFLTATLLDDQPSGSTRRRRRKDILNKQSGTKE